MDLNLRGMPLFKTFRFFQHLEIKLMYREAAKKVGPNSPASRPPASVGMANWSHGSLQDPH